MNTELGEYRVLPASGFKTTLCYLMIVVIWCVMLSGCGLMTSQGHFEMAGDSTGIYAVSDMINGLSRSNAKHDEYFRHRRIMETEKTYRDAQPGFWSKVFFGGGLAAKKPASEEDQGS